MHAGPVGIEDPCNFYFETVLTVIIEEKCLGAALSFIIARARSDRVDIPPVILGLRVDRGVAINLAGRGLEDAAPQPLGEAQHVDGAVHQRLRRLHWIVLIVDRRGWASKIVDLVRLDVERERHVVADELKAGMSMKMLQIALGAGEKIVDTEYFVSLLE